MGPITTLQNPVIAQLVSAEEAERIVYGASGLAYPKRDDATLRQQVLDWTQQAEERFGRTPPDLSHAKECACLAITLQAVLAKREKTLTNSGPIVSLYNPMTKEERAAVRNLVSPQERADLKVEAASREYQELYARSTNKLFREMVSDFTVWAVVALRKLPPNTTFAKQCAMERLKLKTLHALRVSGKAEWHNKANEHRAISFVAAQPVLDWVKTETTSQGRPARRQNRKPQLRQTRNLQS